MGLVAILSNTSILLTGASDFSCTHNSWAKKLRGTIKALKMRSSRLLLKAFSRSNGSVSGTCLTAPGSVLLSITCVCCFSNMQKRRTSKRWWILIRSSSKAQMRPRATAKRSRARFRSWLNFSRPSSSLKRQHLTTGSSHHSFVCSTWSGHRSW